MIAGYFYYILSQIITHQVSTRAVVQSREIAVDPILVNAIQQGNVAKVQEQVDVQKKISDADFIVVGDKNGIRLAHPTKEKIGYPMQGGDNADALIHGMHYYSIRQGSLGLAIRGKSPIFSKQGEIIGVVSVGYLFDTVSVWLINYSTPFFLVLITILAFSSVGAWLFSRHIKKQMYGMEPEEIALSLRVQSSVLEAVYEGIIAVDDNEQILSINQHALTILGIASDTVQLRNQSISDYVTPSDFFVGTTIEGDLDTSEYNLQEITCNGETLIATRVRIWEGEDSSGWVVSFRPRNDLNILTSQLVNSRQEADSLRVVSHEYANKLSTISGMIQIGAYDQALSTILLETENYQKLIDFVTQSFNSKIIAGLLLGKYSKAKELGLTLEFDPYSQLHRLPSSLSEEELVAIIGNLLDNAFEATLKNSESNKTISILLSDDNPLELVIEVADNGVGVSKELIDSLFEKGISSKEETGHGIGLYLVQHYVNKVGGHILIDEADLSGAIFSIFIPNEPITDGNL